MRLTLPTGFELVEWADRVVFDLAPYDVFAPLVNDDWKTWAAQFVRNAVIGFQVPNPDQFDDWRDWAERLCGNLT